MKSNSNTLFMLVIRHIAQFRKWMMARNEEKEIEV